MSPLYHLHHFKYSASAVLKYVLNLNQYVHI